MFHGMIIEEEEAKWLLCLFMMMEVPKTVGVMHADNNSLSIASDRCLLFFFCGVEWWGDYHVKSRKKSKF